jgi:hypothetical protein
MTHRKLVVIGGDAAGMSAASKVRREHPEREIVVFERGRHTSYAACGMPYYIAGQIDSAEKLVARAPEVFREKQRIDVRTRHEVVADRPRRPAGSGRDLESRTGNSTESLGRPADRHGRRADRAGPAEHPRAGRVQPVHAAERHRRVRGHRSATRRAGR